MPGVGERLFEGVPVEFGVRDMSEQRTTKSAIGRAVPIVEGRLVLVSTAIGTLYGAALVGVGEDPDTAAVMALAMSLQISLGAWLGVHLWLAIKRAGNSLLDKMQQRVSSLADRGLINTPNDCGPPARLPLVIRLSLGSDSALPALMSITIGSVVALVLDTAFEVYESDVYIGMLLASSGLTLMALLLWAARYLYLEILVRRRERAVGDAPLPRHQEEQTRKVLGTNEVNFVVVLLFSILGMKWAVHQEGITKEVRSARSNARSRDE